METDCKDEELSETNLLILDETFDSSLDHEGVENLLKILYTLGEDTNVFVISHKGDILDGKFENKIEFKKKETLVKCIDTRVRVWYNYWSLTHGVYYGITGTNPKCSQKLFGY